MEGVEKVLVSGTYALMIPSEGQEFKKATVRKAFSEKGLKLEGLSLEEYDKPVAGIRYNGRGGG